MSDWIKVETKLPKQNEKVLISNCRGTHIGFLNEQNKWAEVSRPSYELKTVTHWQHLPAPPIGKEAKNKICLYYPENLLCAIFDKFSYDEIGANCDIEIAKERVELKISDVLSPREKDILFLRYKEGLSKAEVGRKYRLSTERIRQIENKCLRRLRLPKRRIYILAGTENNP